MVYIWGLKKWVDKSCSVIHIGKYLFKWIKMYIFVVNNIWIYEKFR